MGRTRNVRTDFVGRLKGLDQQKSSRSFTVFKEARLGVDT